MQNHGKGDGSFNGIFSVSSHKHLEKILPRQCQRMFRDFSDAEQEASAMGGCDNFIVDTESILILDRCLVILGVSIIKQQYNWIL